MDDNTLSPSQLLPPTSLLTTTSCCWFGHFTGALPSCSFAHSKIRARSRSMAKDDATNGPKSFVPISPSSRASDRVCLNGGWRHIPGGRVAVNQKERSSVSIVGPQIDREPGLINRTLVRLSLHIGLPSRTTCTLRISRSYSTGRGRIASTGFAFLFRNRRLYQCWLFREHPRLLFPALLAVIAGVETRSCRPSAGTYTSLLDLNG